MTLLHDSNETLTNVVSLRPQSQADDEASLFSRENAAAIARGERRAEEQFVKKHTPGLLIMLRVRCKDYELCRDISQDALRITLERLRAGKIDQPEAVGGFLRGTALNLLANELRRSERRLTEQASDWLDDVVSESSTPLDTVESDDLVHAVRTTIAGLKVARDRELLWRFYVDEEPKDRLCKIFELSSEHFDRVLHRARSRLKQILGTRFADARCN